MRTSAWRWGLVPMAVGCMSCGDEDVDVEDAGISEDAEVGEDAGGDRAVTLSGAVQKGPFVLGTSIGISTVDERGNPTGQVFNTQTTNDLGEFSVDFSYLGFVSLEGNGFYYNEVTGQLSAAPGTLRALHEVTAAGAQAAYINLVTHLSHNRVRRLLQDGAAFPDAVAQAEQELRLAIGVGISGFDPNARGIEMNILGGDTDANAYLLAVSAVLAEAAVLRGGPIDASLQELINTAASDLAEDGSLEASVTGELVSAQREVATDEVMAFLGARLTELGSNAPVPDIDRIIDTDQDGLVNRQDNCRHVPNPDQLDTNADGVGGACSAARIVLASGDGQSGATGSDLAAPLVVRVEDEPGNGVRGVDVSFVVTAGGGSVTAVATTDETGHAAATLTAGAPGTNLVEARMSGVAGSPVVFTAIVVGFAEEVAFTTAANPDGVAIGDLNGDDRPDVAVAANDNAVSVLINTTEDGAATPGFAPRVDVASISVPVSVALADLNADGKLDLAVANSTGSHVSVFLNTTKDGAPIPTFAAGAEFDTPAGPSSVAIDDLNGDDKPDLAVANENGASTVSVLLNVTPDGELTPELEPAFDFATGERALAVAIADLNRDGKPDLTVVNSDSASVSVLLHTTPDGDLTPSFAGRVDFSTASDPASVAIGDVDGDGTPDLAVQSNAPRWSASILLNTTVEAAEVPTFADSVEFTTWGQSAAIADLNGDARPDLACPGGPGVWILPNAAPPGLGAPSFAEAVMFSTGEFPKSVAIADLNADGKPDLVVTAWSFDSISVLLGL